MPKKYEQTFTVDRSKWLNSHTFLEHESVLYAKKGKQEMMCCLGFVCNQLGIPKKDLIDWGHPDGLADKWDIPYLLKSTTTNFTEVGKKIIWSDSELASDAIDINDDESISLKEKERKLKLLFNQHGLNIKFVGKYPKDSKK